MGSPDSPLQILPSPSGLPAPQMHISAVVKIKLITPAFPSQTKLEG